VANRIKATWPEAGQVKMRLFDGSLVSVFKYQPEGTMNNPKKNLYFIGNLYPGLAEPGRTSEHNSPGC